MTWYPMIAEALVVLCGVALIILVIRVIAVIFGAPQRFAEQRQYEMKLEKHLEAIDDRLRRIENRLRSDQ